MNDDNERENENLLPQRGTAHYIYGQLLKQKNLGNILRGSLYVIAFLMVVTAFVMSATAISQSNKTPVKYPTYERIGKKECPDIGGTSMIYSGVTISYSFYNNTPTSYAGFFDACLLIKNISTIIWTSSNMTRN